MLNMSHKVALLFFYKVYFSNKTKGYDNTTNNII